MKPLVITLKNFNRIIIYNNELESWLEEVQQRLSANSSVYDLPIEKLKTLSVILSWPIITIRNNKIIVAAEMRSHKEFITIIKCSKKDSREIENIRSRYTIKE